MDLDFKLKHSPQTFFDKNFIDDTSDLKCFVECSKLTGWKKNNVQVGTSDYKLNRETIVFVDADVMNKLKTDPKNFKVPAIWGKDVTVIEFPPQLRLIKERIENRTGWKYNIALGNRYLTGKDKIAFHSDNEEFGNTQSIASLSLGVPRQFSFIDKNVGTKQTLTLTNGSLLFMGPNCQENYIHGMFPEKIVDDPIFGTTRINVTFRVWNYKTSETNNQ